MSNISQCARCILDSATIWHKKAPKNSISGAFLGAAVFNRQYLKANDPDSYRDASP
jgi:hypothetical protein